MCIDKCDVLFEYKSSATWDFFEMPSGKSIVVLNDGCVWQEKLYYIGGGEGNYVVNRVVRAKTEITTYDGTNEIVEDIAVLDIILNTEKEMLAYGTSRKTFADVESAVIDVVHGYLGRESSIRRRVRNTIQPFEGYAAEREFFRSSYINQKVGA